MSTTLSRRNNLVCHTDSQQLCHTVMYPQGGQDYNSVTVQESLCHSVQLTVSTTGTTLSRRNNLLCHTDSQQLCHTVIYPQGGQDYNSVTVQELLCHSVQLTLSQRNIPPG